MFVGPGLYSTRLQAAFRRLQHELNESEAAHSRTTKKYRHAMLEMRSSLEAIQNQAKARSEQAVRAAHSTFAHLQVCAFALLLGAMWHHTSCMRGRGPCSIGVPASTEVSVCCKATHHQLHCHTGSGMQMLESALFEYQGEREPACTQLPQTTAVELRRLCAQMRDGRGGLLAALRATHQCKARPARDQATDVQPTSGDEQAADSGVPAAQAEARAAKESAAAAHGVVCKLEQAVQELRKQLAASQAREQVRDTVHWAFYGSSGTEPCACMLAHAVAQVCVRL